VPEFTINSLPPSPNQLRGQHWSVAHRARKKVQAEVWYSWLCAGKPLANGRKAVLQLHIEAHGLRDDEDNRTARMKPVLDSLVDVGALQDDSPQYLEMRIPTRAKGEKGKPRITIHIDYLEDDEPKVAA
jgi:hypothetical protein